MRGALTFNPKDSTRLAARGNLKTGFAVNGGHLHLSTEGSLGKVDQKLIVDIITIPAEELISRVESDIRTRRFTVYLRTYLNELWLINSHYFEFVQQFYEVAEKVKIPQEAAVQYNRFVTEYNAFAQDFRDRISELKKVAKTEIEPPSVKLASELTKVETLPPAEKKTKLPEHPEHKGYIL